MTIFSTLYSLPMTDALPPAHLNVDGFIYVPVD
jgi:hypothetical protein